MRSIIGLLAGILAALVAIWLVGLIGGQFYAIEAPTDPRIGAELVAALGAAPTGLKLFLVLSWFAGGLAGAAAAKRVAGVKWPAWTVAGGLALLLGTMFLVPLPVWMQAMGVIAPLAGGLLADLLVRTRGAADQA